MKYLSKYMCVMAVLMAYIPGTYAEMMPMAKRSSMQGGEAPVDARSSDYSDGYRYRGMKGWETTDDIVVRKVLADQTEYRSNTSGKNTLRYDTQAWQGTDNDKIWLKLEGSQEVAAKVGNLEFQALYSHSVSPFWDIQVGGRYDKLYSVASSQQRFLGVLGFQGLAPYWFEVEPALFVDDKGGVSARIRATYDILLNQRLILRPRLEVNAAVRENRTFGVAQGINDVQLGVRLRYEFSRKFAPYIGVARQQQTGKTASLARLAGEPVSNTSWIAGVRWWF